MADHPTFGHYDEMAPDKMTAEARAAIMTKHDDSSLGRVIKTAERELGAFISAVTDLYGSEQARISTEEWLDELNSMDRLPDAKTYEWRLITAAAATLLAIRLSEMGLLRTAHAKSSVRTGPPTAKSLTAAVFRQAAFD